MSLAGGLARASDARVDLPQWRGSRAPTVDPPVSRTSQPCQPHPRPRLGLVLPEAPSVARAPQDELGRRRRRAEDVDARPYLAASRGLGGGLREAARVVRDEGTEGVERGSLFQRCPRGSLFWAAPTSGNRTAPWVPARGDAHAPTGNSRDGGYACRQSIPDLACNASLNPGRWVPRPRTIMRRGHETRGFYGSCTEVKPRSLADRDLSPHLLPLGLIHAAYPSR